MPLTMTNAEIYQFIAKQKLGVLGTVSPKGLPQSALVEIAVTPELEIIFDTVKISRKFHNLIVNPNCSFVVGWTGEITLQYEGEVQRPEGDALRRYQDAYFARWPDGSKRLSRPGVTCFAVRPIWIRYTDFEPNPPFIQEFTFAKSSSLGATDLS
jgi:pyridoxine/pyridoxamine 5'-phosphate oxidase